MTDLLITLVASAANIILGGIVILRNSKHLSSRVFFASSVAISAWAVTTYLSDHAQTALVADLTTRLAYSTVFLAVALLSLFSLLFPRQLFKERRSQLVMLGYAVLLLGGSLFGASDLVVGSTKFQPGLT